MVAELKVDLDNTYYKQKLGALQQQEELSKNESKRKKMLDVYTEFHLVLEEDSARMTTEQLKELAEALSIMSAKSSVLEEGGERRALIAENLQAEEDSKPSSTKRTQTMHTKIDSQLDACDPRVAIHPR
ncbi:hypothetical protein JVT61DRAFT_2547 [Boletus reticuloceps]|uniref:Uncharacterized protein n=1 Tax=Boletus reticuloceps TaxID=495285 RepID=A0A8I3ABE3_9AGAM|nr:hypothetical protein JVT61DRAFT_2547 [Boletus reticuloceps]